MMSVALAKAIAAQSKNPSHLKRAFLTITYCFLQVPLYFFVSKSHFLSCFKLPRGLGWFFFFSISLPRWVHFSRARNNLQIHLFILCLPVGHSALSRFYENNSKNPRLSDQNSRLKQVTHEGQELRLRTLKKHSV